MDPKVVLEQKLKILENILNKAEKAGRGLSDEEKELYNETEDEVKNLQTVIKQRAELTARREELMKAVTPKPVSGEVSNVTVGQDRSTNKPWKNFGEFLGAVADVHNPSKHGVVDNRLLCELPRNATGASVSVGSDGGFMVGTQFIAGVMESIVDESDLLSRITRIPIGEGYNGISVPTLAETSRADGSRWGGIRSYWVNEGATATASKPTFGTLDLKLSKLLAFVYATDELIRDSSALETWILDKLPKELAFKVDDAIVNGSGNGIPLGFLGCGALVEVAKETSQVADTIVFENVLKMWSRMPVRNRKNAIWAINQESEVQLSQMSIKIKNVAGSENVGGVPVYMPAGGVTNAPYSTIYGRPVIPIEQCPALGDKGDINLIDPTDYIGIDKGGITSDTSIHVNFLYDEQLFRFRYRFNGAPYTNSAVQSYANSSHTYSPYVTLAARA